jgi:DNA polymerase-3 subunit gamma/tau
MSYLALARKWRPKTFADVAGQGHVVRALENALGSGRLHHAFLFTGTRGIGKTTIARIFVKALNCERGVSATPCGECPSCIAIDAGRFVDFLEVDAASRTGIDDIREILDNAQYTPASGRFKVYLIDEVHMLSKQAFNGLLKTLEEPPPHIKFLLRDDRPAEDSGYGPVALPAVQPQAPAAGRHSRTADQHLCQRRAERGVRRAPAPGAGRGRQHA